MPARDLPHATRGPRFWSTDRPDGPWDAVVVGSGMGGMTAAALLSRVGRRVLVLEQHYVPGGFTHAFTRRPWTWDVGVHAVGEVTDHTLTGRILHDLTRGRLAWASLGAVYEQFHYPGGFRIDFPDDPAAFHAALLDAFPERGAEIDDYLGRVRRVGAAMRSYYLARCLPPAVAPVTDRLLARRARRHLARRTGEVLAEVTGDERLRTVLLGQWGYYGSPPSRSSFAMQALVTRHYLHGAYYPEGGSPEIARSLLATVADAGGATRVRADVERVLLEGGRAVGVRLAGGEEIRAPRVVLATGVAAAVRRLLPEEVRRRRWARSIERLAPGPAHVCLYLGFRGDIREAGASGANKWFYSTWSPEDEVWEIPPAGDPGPAPVLYVSFPSLKDPRHDPGPERLHTGEVVTFVPWEAFGRWRGSHWRDRGPAYEELKERLRDTLLRQLLERMPALEPMIAHAELSTPLSTDHFSRPVQGSIYGLEPTPERFANRWLRPRSPIPGLYFAGSEVSTVGVVGAMMGGVLAAVAVAPLAALGHLRALRHA